MSFKEMLKSSSKQLKETKTLTLCGILIALTTVLSNFNIHIGENIIISFSFIPNAIAGMLIGPIGSGLMGGISDIISTIVKSSGGFVIWFTISAIITGFIYGIFLYKKPIKLKNIILARLTAVIISNVIINTLLLCILYGKSFWIIFPSRLLKQVILFPIEIIILYTVFKILDKIGIFKKYL